MMIRSFDIILRYFNWLFLLLILGMYLNALIFPNIGADASFYLRVTECIANGAIPEHDLRILYPPLIFYMLLPFKLLVGKAIAYELFLGYMFLVQFLNAYLIYRITGKYTRENFIRIFAGLLYLFLSMKYEGEYFFLEPFINLWGLLALWTYISIAFRRNIFLLLAGFLTFLAFLTKQYGLAYAGAIYVLILLDHRHSFQKWIIKSLIFTGGLLLGLLLFIVLFRLGYGVFYDFLAGGRIGMYGEKEISGILTGFVEYLKIAPWLLLAFLPAVFRSILKFNYHFIAYSLLTLLFSAQLYFQQYEHYYMLMLPGIILIGIMIFNGINKIDASKCSLIIVIVISLFVNEYLLSPRTKNLLFSTQSTLSSEIKISQRINHVIPEESKVHLFANVKFYYLCQFNPVIPEKYGFAWNHMTMSSDLHEILERAPYIIVDNIRFNKAYPLIDKKIKLSQEIKHFDFDIIAETDGLMIYQKPSAIY